MAQEPVRWTRGRIVEAAILLPLLAGAVAPLLRVLVGRDDDSRLLIWIGGACLASPFLVGWSAWLLFRVFAPKTPPPVWAKVTACLLAVGGLVAMTQVWLSVRDVMPTDGKITCVDPYFLWSSPEDPLFNSGRFEVGGVLTDDAANGELHLLVPKMSGPGYVDVGDAYRDMQVAASRSEAGIGPTGVVAKLSFWVPAGRVASLRQGSTVVVSGRNPRRVTDPRNPLGYYIVISGCTLK